MVHARRGASVRAARQWRASQQECETTNGIRHRFCPPSPDQTGPRARSDTIIRSFRSIGVAQWPTRCVRIPLEATGDPAIHDRKTPTRSKRRSGPSRSTAYCKSTDAVAPNSWSAVCSIRRCAPASSSPRRSTRPTSTRSRASTSRRIPGDRGIERRIKSLIRWNAMAMVVRANRDDRRASAATSPPSPRRRRSTKSASTTSSAAAATDERRGDLIYLPGPRLARHLRARLPRRPPQRRAAAELPPRARAGRRPLVAIRIRGSCRTSGSSRRSRWASARSASIYQARFNRYLANRGLARHRRQPRLGLPRRRRDGRARVARRHHARLAREARQPDLGRQLQPAAARRPGARQRQDHPGARGGLPRRRLERHQGHLGRRLGSAARRRRHDGLLVKRMGEVVDGEYQKYVVASRRLHPRALLRQLPRDC